MSGAKVGDKWGVDYYLFRRIIPSRAIIWMGADHAFVGVHKSVSGRAPCRRRAWHSHHGWQTIRGAAVGQGSSEHDSRGVFALRHGGHASNIMLMVGMLDNL
jgi:hypothetical protein